MPEDIQLSSLYQQLILEHYRKPRNKRDMDPKSVEVHMANPTCGDEIRLQLRIEEGEITDAAFVGQGCSISQAAVSMMTDLLKGSRLEEADALADRFTSMMHGEEEAARDRSLGDLRALQGVSRFPVRIRCALLGFDALQEAIEQEREGGAATEGGAEEATEPSGDPGETGEAGESVE